MMQISLRVSLDMLDSYSLAYCSLLFEFGHKMDPVARKTFFGVSDKVTLKLVCSATGTN